MKKIVIVGGGFTSLVLSIMLKQNLADKVKVTILEKNEEIAKKLTVTGNGKCNILNKNFHSGLIFGDEFFKEVFEKVSYEDLKDFYNSIGLPTINKGDLIYPYNESAKQTRDYLVSVAKKLDVKFECNQFVKSFYKVNDIYLINTQDKEYKADYLIFATGGKSYSNLGADCSVLTLLKDNGCEIKETKPALCAIKIKENVKKLEGVRSKVELTILEKDKEVFKEKGEILFKKDGISGIVSFDASLYLAYNYSSFKDIKIKINLIPNFDEYIDLINQKYWGSAEILQILTQKKIIDYFSKSLQNLNEIKNVLENFIVSPVDFYGYESAQITVGGINLVSLNSSLEVKENKNLYIGGELLDISGYCGGYNLSMCLASALIVSRSIKEDF